MQNLCCSLQGGVIQRSRFGASFECRLAESEGRTAWSYDEVSALRNRRLQSFVLDCADSVPFYRQWFRLRAGVDPRDILSISDLQCLPVLTKARVLEDPSEFLSERVPVRGRIPAHTSGTTGGGLRFSTMMAAVQEQWAVWWRYRRWHGCCNLAPGAVTLEADRWVPLSQTKPPFWRYNVPGRQILFSAYHISPSHLGAYVQELRRRRPPWLHGYPSLLCMLASHVLDQGADLGYSVQWITIGVDNLMPHQSELIQRAFGVRPRQHYGMAEAVANISECEQGALHVDEDFAAVEFLPYSVLGRGTGSLAPTFPIPPFRCCAMRFRILRPSRDGLSLRSAGTHGRQCGWADGGLHHIARWSAPGSSRPRIQGSHERAGGADRSAARRADLCAVGEGPRVTAVPTQRLLLQELRSRIGIDTKVEINYVESLPRSRSGKLRFVVSEIPEGQLQRAA